MLGKRRSEMLAFLSETNAFSKYKQLSGELVTLRADITSLERQRGFVHRLQELRSDIRALAEERGRLQTQIEAAVDAKSADKDSLFSAIRLYFNEIVEEVLDRKALLSVAVNQFGHLEFKAEMLDEAGNATSADLGHTYKKLLCIAFDMAVLRAHLDEKFPRFACHDGVFESLDNRKKENLLKVIRDYTSLGIQSIITLIDSDLPPRDEKGGQVFDPGEIVLLLHDEDERGRLFEDAAVAATCAGRWPRSPWRVRPISATRPTPPIFALRRHPIARRSLAAWLALAAFGRAPGASSAADLELADQRGELGGLVRHRSAGGGRFLRRRGVLLRHLVHVADGGIDLVEVARLLLGAHRDRFHHLIDLVDLGEDALQRLAGLADQRHALAHLRFRGGDERLDLLGGLGRALGERPHLGGDDGEAAAASDTVL